MTWRRRDTTSVETGMVGNSQMHYKHFLRDHRFDHSTNRCMRSHLLRLLYRFTILARLRKREQIHNPLLLDINIIWNTISSCTHHDLISTTHTAQPYYSEFGWEWQSYAEHKDGQHLTNMSRDRAERSTQSGSWSWQIIIHLSTIISLETSTDK